MFSSYSVWSGEPKLNRHCPYRKQVSYFHGQLFEINVHYFVTINKYLLSCIYIICWKNILQLLIWHSGLPQTGQCLSFQTYILRTCRMDTVLARVFGLLALPIPNSVHLLKPFFALLCHPTSQTLKILLFFYACIIPSLGDNVIQFCSNTA